MNPDHGTILTETYYTKLLESHTFVDKEDILLVLLSPPIITCPLQHRFSNNSVGVGLHFLW